MKLVGLCVLFLVVGALAVNTTTTSSEFIEIKPVDNLLKKCNLWYEKDGPCCQLCYTQWFDRDEPSGYGDYETLVLLKAENPGKICKSPCAIQVQTLSGAEAFTTGQVFQSYDTVNGFACVNTQQRKGEKCLDYKVRFACPC